VTVTEPAKASSKRKPLSAGDRMIFALVLGGWGAFISYFSMASHPQHLAKDFSYPWRAARALLAGENPYEVIRAVGEYPFNSGLMYPLPAAVLVTPFAHLRPEIAGALFFGIGSALLGWAILRDCPHRWPLFLSAPFIHAAVLGQWSPILTAAALMPTLQFLGAAKPTVGLAAWIYNPTRRGIIGGLIVVAIAFAVQPGWLGDWLEVAGATKKYRGPATTVLGAFLLLGLVALKRREGRLFVAMSIVPQLPVFYDALILWLVPTTMWRTFFLSAVSWVGYLAWFPHRASPLQNDIAFPWLVFTIYAPALLLLLSDRATWDSWRRPGTSAGVSPPAA
jgi:hypothetical protein